MASALPPLDYSKLTERDIGMREVPGTMPLDCACKGKWLVDETKSINENLYLRMQVDGELEIINWKKSATGENLFRVRWGGHNTSNHHFSHNTGLMYFQTLLTLSL